MDSENGMTIVVRRAPYGTIDAAEAPATPAEPSRRGC